MKKCDYPVVVCSRTFSKHPVLREETLNLFSNVKFNDEGAKLSDQALVDFLAGAKGAIVALEKINEPVLSKLPELEVISKYGVGLDNIDASLLQRFDVKLGWQGGVNRRSVSELALALVMSLIRKVSQHNLSVKKGEWINQHGFQLTKKTVGIVGAGFIGKDLIELLSPFECRILINDIVEMKEFCEESKATQVSLDELLQESDVVSLHVPYTDKTHHLINHENLKLVKSNAVLVNTSRGNVVCEKSLYEKLLSTPSFSAGLDVFSQEPPSGSQLLGLENFMATPHNGGSSSEGVLNMGRSAIGFLYKLLMSEEAM